ncbi:hypothetical protein Ana3638_20550 [Anaerocolumna sedimenticola]|uniref:Uncharacterized protein n=1 Tax=Anaerocolumna sedimenticola TaxID=2696063 RepID=A0A6P1TPF7_9FIRM|nr:hypothetical protein [Anaerocolumna sedimenticola]QHQ62874.1 hypothetical protein Ana3638_20550 [Anaerocolumna sedimenticola]
MDNSLKGLILAAGVIITCLVVGIGFYISREASAAATNGTGQISRMNKEVAESDKVMYDGLDVTGSEVINAINKYKSEDISVKVQTKKSIVYYNRLLTDDDKELGNDSSASVKNTQQITSDYYINQKAQFTGEILRDVNDTIIGISFVQQ